MFWFPGMTNQSRDMEDASVVHSTGVALSDRFRSVPSHNPLRPNSGVIRRVTGCEDYNTRSNKTIIANMGRVACEQGGRFHKLAVVNAKKEVEIIRLRAQVRTMEMQLGRGSGSVQRMGKFDALGSIQKFPMKNRVGRVKRRGSGGFVVGQRGRSKLTARSSDGLSSLGVERVLRDPRSHGNNTSKGRRNLAFSGGRNVLATGRRKFSQCRRNSKDELDKELESYMSKAKSKQKVDLDKELDVYMKKAGSKSFAGMVGLVPLPQEPTTTTPSPVATCDSSAIPAPESFTNETLYDFEVVAPDSNEMEIVE